MSRPVGFNPETGIAGIISPRTEEISIPFRGSGLPPALSRGNHVPGFDTYAGRNLDSVIYAALQPRIGNPDLMRPEIFHRTLQNGLKKLKKRSKNKALDALYDRIEENTDLLKTYERLVIAG